MTLGERIVALRKELGITQGELAEQVGVCRQTICHYENDHRDPGLFEAACIADALGVSIDYLAKGGNRDYNELVSVL